MPRILTGNGSGSDIIVDLQDMKNRLSDTADLLNALIDGAVLPALKRNWQSCNFVKHTAVSRGEEAASKRGAPGNVILIQRDSAEITYDRQSFKYIDYLIDGRGPVFPVRAKALAYNLQYRQNVVFRKSSAPTTGKAIYYLTGADTAKMERIVFWFVGGGEGQVAA